MHRYRTLASLALLLSAALLAACTTGSEREAPRTAAPTSKIAASRAESSPHAPEPVARKPIAAKRRPGTQRDATEAKRAPSKAKGSTAAKRPAKPSPSTDTPPARASKSFKRPAAGAIVRSFDGASNKGVDIGGVSGDPVYAAGGGRVVFASSALRGYGQLLMVKHDATYVTAYAHNSRLLVKEGDTVKAGQVIARMGDSGTDRVKLHFELRRHGKAVDPVPYFSDRD